MTKGKDRREADGSRGVADPEARRVLSPGDSALRSVLRRQAQDSEAAISRAPAPGVGLRFKGGWTPADSGYLRHACDAALVRAQRDFGPDILPVEVVAYASASALRDSPSFLGRARPPSGVVGWFDGAVRVARVAGLPLHRERLLAVLTHELTHHAVSRLSSARVPACLDEGLALVRSQLLTERHVLALRSAREAERLLPVEVLMAPFMRLAERGGDVSDLAEAQAAALARAILRDPCGWEGVRAVLSFLGARPPESGPSEAAENLRDALAATCPGVLARLASRSIYDDLLEAPWD